MGLLKLTKVLPDKFQATAAAYLAAAPDVVLHLGVAVASPDVHLGGEHLLDVLLPLARWWVGGWVGGLGGRVNTNETGKR